MRAQRANFLGFLVIYKGETLKNGSKNGVKIKTGVQIFGQILLKIKTPQRNLADLDLKGGFLILIPR